MRIRKTYRIDRAARSAHERRVAEGLYDLAEALRVGSQDVRHLNLASDELVDELAEVIEAHERDDCAIAEGLDEENPSEAAAARHRARAWRRLARRLPRRARARVNMGRVRAAKAPRPSGVSSRPAFMRSEVDGASTEPPTPNDPERSERRPGESLDIDTADALRELADEVRQLRVEVRALRDECRQGASSTAPEPRFLSPDQACAELGISRASFDRWLADPTTKLADAILQPGGPGTKVIVPMDAFVAWWGRRRSRGTARARRRA